MIAMHAGKSFQEGIACLHTHLPTTTEEHYGTYIVNLDVKHPLGNPRGFHLTIEASKNSKQRNIYSEYIHHATQENSIEKFLKNFNLTL
jgi:hypothetical protein